jgi:hypothetical protein
MGKAGASEPPAQFGWLGKFYFIWCHLQVMFTE